MAINFDITTLVADNSTAARFRAWAQFIHTTMTLAGGWINTADTGQVDLTTVAAPGGVNTSMGYKIYRMNDPFQSTKPVFIKLEFGSGSGAAAQPSLWLTVGTGSDGAGNITGGLLARTQWQNAGNNTSVSKSYGSVGPSRMTIAMFTFVNASPLVISIERTIDGNGLDTNEGVIVNMARFATPVANSYFLPFTGSVPPSESGFHVVLTTQSPSTFGSNIGTSLVIPMAGAAKQPGMNLLAVRASDFTDGAAITFAVYGGTRTYQHLGPTPSSFRAASIAGGAQDANIRLAIRYD